MKRKRSHWIFQGGFKRQKRAGESPQKCAECHMPINNGEVYTGEIWKHYGRLITLRRHENCTTRLERGHVWCAITALSLIVPTTTPITR